MSYKEELEKIKEQMKQVKEEMKNTKIESSGYTDDDLEDNISFSNGFENTVNLGSMGLGLEEVMKGVSKTLEHTMKGMQIGLKTVMNENVQESFEQMGEKLEDVMEKLEDSIEKIGEKLEDLNLDEILEDALEDLDLENFKGKIHVKRDGEKIVITTDDEDEDNDDDEDSDDEGKYVIID